MRRSPGCARGSLGSSLCLPHYAGVMSCHTSSERGIQGTPLSAHEPRRPHSLCNVCWEGRSRPLPCLQSASSADAPQEQSPAMKEYHRASPTLAASLTSPLCTTLRRCGRGIQHTLLESILTHMCCLRLHPLRGTTLFLSTMHKRFPPSSSRSPLICRLCHLLQCSSWKSPALRIVEAS